MFSGSIEVVTNLTSKRIILPLKKTLHKRYNIIKKNYPVIDQPIDIEKFVNDMEPNDLTIETVRKYYISFWKQQISNSTKLSFCTTFKNHCNLKEYFKIIKTPTRKECSQNFEVVITN
jgi:hypothetical protein